MIWTLKCRNNKRYKRVRRPHCCWTCLYQWLLHRQKATRRPKPSPQAELPLGISLGAEHDKDWIPSDHP